MHMRSPATYNFFRNKFDCNLPHENTIKKWYANSNCNGEPGIQLGCLETLSNLVSEYRKKNEILYCSLSFDEMSIKQHIQWSDNKKKFLGYVSYGNDDKQIATHAIVFLVTGINSMFSIPIAFHFIQNSFGPDDKAKLLIEVIKSMTNIGVMIVNVTFDGLPTNFAVCKKLGASFNTNDLRPYFEDPIDKHRIYIILDACHMLKLWRNTIGNHKQIIDGNGQIINWEFFELLENCRIKNEFVTHKLTKRHINWEKDKMNVRLAAQTLSNSNSKSLLYLKENECDGFDGCTGTAEFCKRANHLFDIFNTKIPKNGVGNMVVDGMEDDSFKNKILDEFSKEKILRVFE